MRNIAARRIRKLVSQKDIHLLMVIRKYFGEQTKDMEYNQLYKKAKKLYTMKVPEIKFWRKKGV